MKKMGCYEHKIQKSDWRRSTTNLPMDLRDIELWDQGLLSGFALPYEEGFYCSAGDIVGIQEPFKRLIVKDCGSVPQKKRTVGVIYRSDKERVLENDDEDSYDCEQSQRWSPANQLPNYAVRRKAIITSVKIKPLDSFTEADLRILHLDYDSQNDPQVLIDGFLQEKNLQILYSWWEKHYKRTLKSCCDPLAAILYLKKVL